MLFKERPDFSYDTSQYKSIIDLFMLFLYNDFGSRVGFMKPLIIIPAYNEEKSILRTVETIRKFDESLNYVVINDGSTDNTKKILEENNINYIDLPFNLGIGAAVQTGYKYAYRNGYDIAIQFDGDGQHDITYVNKLIDKIEKGANMVIGSRYVDNVSTFKSTRSRQLGIKIISGLIKFLSGKRIKDVTSGFRAADRKVMELFCNNYPFDYPEPITNYALLKLGFKIDEVGVNMFERNGGKSSINFIKSIYYMFNVCLSIILFKPKKIKEKIL